MIHEKSHSRPKIRRKGMSRSLNIIYFIDAHKTIFSIHSNERGLQQQVSYVLNPQTIYIEAE